MRKLLLSLSLLSLAAACTNDPPPSKKPPAVQQSANAEVALIAPLNGATVNLGDTIRVALQHDAQKPTDSVILRIGNQLLSKVMGSTPQIEVRISNCKLGSQRLSARFFFKDGSKQDIGQLLNVYAGQQPAPFSYKVLREFPHPKEHYTQGFEYHDGKIIEGTGIKGRSVLDEYKLGELTIDKGVNLESKYFGEGITKLGNRIYQITWKSRKGFIYNAKTFELEREFNYPSEGWGLTNNGNQIIMSDGSENIYFLDPQSLVELKRIQVYDNIGAVKNINELEYVDGKIYANIYLTDGIISIDPETGAVLEQMDMLGLLNVKAPPNEIDVLNGIAYKADTKTFLLTGKLWPKIFEVEFIKR